MPVDSSDRGPRRSRTWLLALSASAVLHLALVALLPPAPAPAPPRPDVVAFEVELRPAPPRDGEPSPTAAAPPAAPTAPSRPSPPARPRRGDARQAASPPLAPAPPGAGLPAGEAAEGSGGGLAAPGEPPALAAPDLRVRPPAELIAGLEAGGGGGETPAADPLRDWAREQSARARVDSGAVDPYLRDVGRSLLDHWDAAGTLRRRGLAGYLAQAGQNVLTYGRVWQRMAEGYGSSGSPGLVDGGSERMRELSGLPPGPARDAALAVEVQRQLQPAYSEGHVTLVRVTQAPSGPLLSVELLSPSRDAELDHAAVEGARAAARTLAPPPGDVLAGKDRLVSLWAFEVEVSITPPVPVVGLEFDEVLGLGDVRVPLDRRIWKRVRLVALY